MTTRTARLGLGLLAAGALALGLATPAGAHVTADKDTVPAGGSTTLSFTVGHGCEDSPTRQIAVQVPEGVLNAAPQVLVGWDVEATETALDEPVESSHGEPQTERVSEITWTAQDGNELDPHFRQVFTIGFTAPEEVGQRLQFGVIQTCVEGETAWIEDTPEGGEEPESPAPFVTVGEAEAGDGHDATEPADDGDAATSSDAEAAAGTPASSTGSDDGDDSDGGTNGLAIAGIVLGLLGLAAGGTALLRSRPAS